MPCGTVVGMGQVVIVPPRDRRFRAAWVEDGAELGQTPPGQTRYNGKPASG